MQKIGDITDTADHNGEFTDGNVAGNIQPTELMAAWFTTVQRELIAVLAEAGITPDKKNDAQLVAALKAILAKAVGGAHYLTVEKNLAEIAAKGAPAQVEARTNLGLKGAAVLDVGQKAGTVAAGDDTRITGALQKGNNLSEIAAAGVPAQTAARVNLGLKTGSVHDVQPTPTDSTPETLLKMGSFGIGTPIRVDSIGPHTNVWQWCDDQVTGAYYFPSLVPNLACHVIYLFRDTSQSRTWFYFGIRTDTANPSFDITLGCNGKITSGIGKYFAA